MAGTRRPSLRQQVANASRRRLSERLDAREATRKLLASTITARLEDIRRMLRRDPPEIDGARERLDVLLGTIADEQARLDRMDIVDRERMADLANPFEEQD